MDTSSWLILLAALLPAVVLLVYILIKDRQRPEPFMLIVKGFFYGCLSAGVALLFVLIPELFGLLEFNGGPIGGAILNAFFSAAFPEEAAKMLMLWLLVRKNPYFDEYLDGIVYAVCIGMGFAATENIMYLFSHVDTWHSVAVGRAFLAVPCHFCLAVFMGYFFALAFFKSKKWYFVLAYLIPVLFHGIYDSCAFMGNVPSIGVSAGSISLLLILLMIRFFRGSTKAIDTHLTIDDYTDSDTMPVHRMILHIDPEWKVIPTFGTSRQPMSLKEILASLIKDDKVMWIGDIIQYNIPLRDGYRDMGARLFTKELLQLADNNNQMAYYMQCFNQRILQEGGIADYDIQIYDKSASLTFFGVTIQGLEGLKQRVECTFSAKYGGTPSVRTPLVSDVHVGQVWESYPSFDSYDFADNRTYDNYLIRDHAITAQELSDVARLQGAHNSNRVTEHIVVSCLPLVYYDGSGDTILVATEKK